jgi:hypothetical protein
MRIKQLKTDFVCSPENNELEGDGGVERWVDAEGNGSSVVILIRSL